MAVRRCHEHWMPIPGLQTDDFFQVDPGAALENSALFWKRHALSYCKPPSAIKRQGSFSQRVWLSEVPSWYATDMKWRRGMLSAIPSGAGR